MREGVKALIEFATTLAEVLGLVVASFASAAPIVKLVLCCIPLASMAWRFVANRKSMKEDQNVTQQ